jgi:hypothetical protein
MKAHAFVKATLRAAFLLALGCLAANPAPAGDWFDPQGDVTLPNADVVSGSATVFEGVLDLRLRFAAPPFPETTTTNIVWCFDTDRSASTGTACGSAAYIGADAWVHLDGRPGALSTCNFVLAVSHGTAASTMELDHYSTFWYDPETFTVRLLVPLSFISADPSFHYAVNVAFGGSFGANESAPDSPDFGVTGGFFSSDEGPLPPFGGSLWCTRETVPIDIQPDNDLNIVAPESHGPIAVAVLTTEAFDAATLFWFTARFGPTGTEAVPLDFALEDVDGDGDVDLVLTFNTAQTGIRCGDQSATLTAYGENRHGVQGTAPIRTVGCP